MSLQQPSHMQLSSVQSEGCSQLWRGDRHRFWLEEITGHLDWKRMGHYTRPGCTPELPLGRDLQNSQGWLHAELCRRALPAPQTLKRSLRSSLRCSAGTLGGRASLLLSPMKHSSFQTHDRTIPVLLHPRTPRGCAQHSRISSSPFPRFAAFALFPCLTTPASLLHCPKPTSFCADPHRSHAIDLTSAISAISPATEQIVASYQPIKESKNAVTSFLSAKCTQSPADYSINLLMNLSCQTDSQSLCKVGRGNFHLPRGSCPGLTRLSVPDFCRI